MKYLQTGHFFGETDKTVFLDGITLTDTEYTIEKVDWHYHENPYFTFIVNGMIIEGDKKNSHLCSTGNLLFHNRQEPHYNFKPDGYTRGFQVETSPEWFDNFELNLNQFPNYIKIENIHLKILFHNILKETLFFGSEFGIGIESMLIDGFNRLGNLRRFEERKTPLWVKKIDELLHERFMESITLNQLSKELGLHPIYLSQTFPKFFQTGFSDYLRKIKVENSLILLRKKNFSLTEISFNCGFSDQSHYNRCFKQLMHVTPKRYRELILK